ncbi:MAG: hypothetical protein A2018_07065 [Alphaproteobacteria bacterium GWF2_58_20]|nr:MAG: hypothetical protein A2018_07065 [Alphaproteobacteria bacterium GWF2_58_20]
MNQPRSHPRKPATPHSIPKPSEAELSGAAGTGALLRARREQAGLSIADVADRLRIKPGFVEAIESLHVAGLPQGPYAFGFVRSYARFLGLDPQKVLEDFKREAEGIAGKPALVFPEPPGVKRLPAPWIAGLCGVSALLLALVWFAFLRVRVSDPVHIPPPADMLQMVEETPLPVLGMLEETLVDDVPQGIGMEANTPSVAPFHEAPRPEKPLPANLVPDVPELPDMDHVADGSDEDMEEAWVSPAQPAPVAEPVMSSSVYGEDVRNSRVHVRAAADSWIQVVDNAGAVLFSRLLRAGEVYHAPNMPGLSMVTGNAGGVEISVDGRVLPPVGISGQVVRGISLDPPGSR